MHTCSGESEKLVRTLFEMARQMAPSTIFIDEIDSLCSTRGASGEHEASRRVKTELLVQIDGLHSGAGQNAAGNERVVVLAATNFPWDLDEALRRRLEKRIYIPLPGLGERRELLGINLRGVDIQDDVDSDTLADKLDGYSGDDITNICRDAAMNSLRSKIAGKTPSQIREIARSNVHDPICMADFLQSVERINPSVSQGDVKQHEKWQLEFGSV